MHDCLNGLTFLNIHRYRDIQIYEVIDIFIVASKTKNIAFILKLFYFSMTIDNIYKMFF